MVRSLVAGFGAATMLAAAGSLTPAGQAVLGAKHAVAAQATAAVVQQAKPAAKRAVVLPAKTVAQRAVPAKAAHRAQPQARRAAVARLPQAAPAPSGQSLSLNQILPVLLQSQSVPSLASQASLPSLLSQAIPAASPLAGIMNAGSASPLAGIMTRGSSLPDLLQQLTNPVQTPEPASAPQPVQAAMPAAPLQAQPAAASGTQWVPENRH